MKTKPKAWQPIETAPKNIVADYGDACCFGPRILVAGAQWFNVTVARWVHVKDEPKRSTFSTDGNGDVAPTHWMPLPKPPRKRKA